MNFADKNYKTMLIKKLVGPEELLTAYCVGSNMPLIECSESTFNDQAFVFESEDRLKEFSQAYTDKKMPLRGVKYLPKDKMKFFTLLLTAGIDELVYISSSGKHIVKLADFVKKNDFSHLPPQKRPVENPQLLLSGIYFMQEASRPVPPEQKPALKDLEEELAANIVKSTFILPVKITPQPKDEAAADSPATAGTAGSNTSPGSSVPDAINSANTAGDPAGTAASGTKAQISYPLITNNKGETYQPLFTDTLEFSRFNHDNQFKGFMVPFANLDKMMAKDVKGYMLNPGGFHIIITKDLLKGLSIRFPAGE